MQRYIIIAAPMLIALIAGWVYWYFSTQPEPEPEPEPLAILLQVPKAYWAEAEGTIKLGNMAVPGRVRVNYLIYPDQSVVIPNFAVWMDDIDLVVTFLWWEVEREPLRCTEFRNDKAIHGVLENGKLVIPAGAEVIGRSYLERSADGQCKGMARRLDTKSIDVLEIVHDPDADADHFALSTTFETSYQGNDVTVALEADGHFLNRPPLAELEVMGEYTHVSDDGCPGTKKGKPSIAPANTPEGLWIELRSGSYDPDGKWPEQLNLKRPRVDLNFEQWARSRPGGFEFLGATREIGPVLFEAEQEHQLLLWVSDRNGAEGRKLCHFQVAPQR